MNAFGYLGNTKEGIKILIGIGEIMILHLYVQENTCNSQQFLKFVLKKDITILDCTEINYLLASLCIYKINITFSINKYLTIKINLEIN